MSNNVDWLQKLKALGDQDDQDESATAKAAEKIRESGALLTLWPDAIRPNDVGIAPLKLEIRLGDTEIGDLRVEGWRDGTVWIGKIVIDSDYQGHGFGTHAMGILTAIARQEGIPRPQGRGGVRRARGDGETKIVLQKMRLHHQQR